MDMVKSMHKPEYNMEYQVMDDTARENTSNWGPIYTIFLVAILIVGSVTFGLVLFLILQSAIIITGTMIPFQIVYISGGILVAIVFTAALLKIFEKGNKAHNAGEGQSR